MQLQAKEWKEIKENKKAKIFNHTPLGT